jgi:hypothetical protein
MMGHRIRMVGGDEYEALTWGGDVCIVSSRIGERLSSANIARASGMRMAELNSAT